MFSSYIMTRTSCIFRGDDKYLGSVLEVLNPLRQQSMDRHVVPHGHIILIQSQPVFALSPYCCVLSREATNTKFIVFGLTQSVFELCISLH
jgi:hypothetical protein